VTPQYRFSPSGEDSGARHDSLADTFREHRRTYLIVARRIDVEYATQKICSSRRLLVVTLAVIALGLSGCPALMLGSLGYEGYEYHETGHLPGMPPQGGNQESKPQSSPASDDVE